MANSLNRVIYGGLDFNTALDEVLARLQVKYAKEYNDLVASSLGIVITDIVAYLMDTFSFYLDRRASDNYLSTARTRSSVAKLSRQVGHKMAPAVAPSVDVEVSLQSEFNFPISLPIGFQFNGPNGLIFESKETTTWAPGETDTKTITCAQGETRTTSFVSNGVANQVFQIKNIPKGSYITGPGTDEVSQVTVTVNGDEWIESKIMQFEKTNQFEIGYNDSSPTLRFGNGIAGNIPEDGASINITYFVSTGKAGKATSNTITSAAKPLVVSFTTIPLNIDNPIVTSGGSDPEEIEKAKAFAPKLFRANTVNVTGDDYEARASTFVDSVYGAVAVAQAVSVRSADSDVYLQGQLSNINTLVEDLQQFLDANLGAAEAAVAIVSAKTTAVTSKTALITDETSNIDDQLNNLNTAHSSAKAAAIIATNDMSSIQTQIGSVSALVDAMTVAGSSQLTSAHKTAIQAAMSAMTAYTNDAALQANTAYSSLTGSGQTAIQSIAASVDEIDTQISDIDIDIADIETNALIITDQIADLLENAVAIEDDVEDATVNINNHFDSFVSSDCQANLIEVPILTYDPDGFYTTPTIGLQKSLQKYLEKRKEVTQVVKVVGASNLLVGAEIVVRLGVKEGFVETTVKSQVESVLLTVLKGRKFDKTLYLNELYDAVKAANISGIGYINIKLVNSSGLDAEGNLVVEKYQVVTRGTLTTTTEVVAAV